MSDTSIDGVVVPLRPDRTELQALRAENAQLREVLNSHNVIEQAKGAIGARLGITPELAFEMLRGLARSQSRDIDEYAAAVVAKGGRLDG
jgi:AmiR/NasT family two-component response regulator